MAGDFVLLAYARTTPYPYEPQTPLSLFGLGAYLEAHGVLVAYYDERVEPWSHFNELLAQKPLAVGFSVMGGYQIIAARRLSRRARAASPESKIVWGGVLPSCLPREVMNEIDVDCIALGEAEETMRELCRGFASRRADLSGIRGLVWRDRGSIVINPKRPPPQLEQLPFAYHSPTLPLLRRYLEKPATREAVGYETSRGCPSRCGFCYSPVFHGPVRGKSLAKISRELGRLRELGVSSLDIYDDVLMGGVAADIAALCDLLKALSFTWTANLRVDLASADILNRLEDSGCRWLYFGLESNDDATLRGLGKGFSWTQVRAGLALLRDRRIGTVFSLICGLPGKDSEQGVRRSLELAEELHLSFPKAEIQIQSFVPLPGAALYSEAVAQGFRPPDGLEGWAGHDHFRVALPWLKDPALPAKAYLTSFLAYRYRRHLSGFPACLIAYPLHHLSRWRIRRQFFGCYFEKPLYALGMAVLRGWIALRFFCRDGLRAENNR